MVTATWSSTACRQPNFTIDGLDANDPFLNLNNSGATNLQLGLNSMQEGTVNTLSYSVDQGRQGAAQVNFISKSGTNSIHGNLFETWNGSAMNAVNWFINASPGVPAHRARSNVNQFGGSVGGPILRDKLFYFFDLEGIRIALPTATTEHYPSQAFEQYTLSQIPLGGYDPITQTTYAPLRTRKRRLLTTRRLFRSTATRRAVCRSPPLVAPSMPAATSRPWCGA